ncbi:hypothetical protein AGMMS49587_04920 [Spirochaetia bacterium]|nr:hypothetical protein AGMMS49587_04920 [Spirochaetia bacterium]
MDIVVERVVEQLNKLIENRTGEIIKNPDNDVLYFELGIAYLSKAGMWHLEKVLKEEKCYQYAFENFKKAYDLCPLEEYKIYFEFVEKAKLKYELL